MHAAWVTGTGSTTCAGIGVENLWLAAASGQTGIQNGLGRIRPATTPLELALTAIQESMRTAGWDRLNSDDGFILGTTTGQIPLWDKALIAFLRKEMGKSAFFAAFQRQPLGSLLSACARELNFQGPRLLVTSACSASTQSLALAAMWLRSGQVRRCLVGGVDVLCDLTIQGFRSLQLLSDDATKPFDQERKGINLAEGAGFLCLERDPRGPALAAITGFGLSSDGYHMTAPHPEGRGSYRAMKSALASADLSERDIDWVHAHGTGSTHNDQAEATAIATLFHEHQPWVSSTKYTHGHTLGACGAIESILCVEALRKGKILRTFGLERPDPTLPLRHPSAHIDMPIRHVLKNTLGFGGTNAALVISAAGTI